MRSRIGSVLIVLSIGTVVIAQAPKMILPFYNGGKWGYMDAVKNIVICPKYEEAYPALYAPYRVKLGDKYGYIDNTSEVMIKPRFKDAGDFEFGLARVKRNGLEFYIDYHGKKSAARHYSHGVNPEFFQMMDSTYLHEEMTLVEKDGKVGFTHKKRIRREGMEPLFIIDTVPPIYDAFVPIRSQLSYVVFDSLIAFTHQGLYLAGAEVIIDNLEFRYQDLQFFYDKRANCAVHDMIGVKENGLWGYINVFDYDGQIIEPKYLSITSLSKGFAKVEYEKGKFGYIDRRGNEYFFR